MIGKGGETIKSMQAKTGARIQVCTFSYICPVFLSNYNIYQASVCLQLVKCYPSHGYYLQVIPLHLPPGDPTPERTLQIDGTTDQIEHAKHLVNEIISGEV